MIPELPSWTLSMAFLFKVLAGFCFLYIYTEYYGDGALSADANQFMNESKILNNVFYDSPSNYFKFLFGINDTNELVSKYLQSTAHWDMGAQAIINDNRNILRIHSLIHFFSFNYVSIHILTMCFISLLGIKNIYISIKKHSFMKPILVFWILVLIPSVIFWSSSILKEPLMLFGFSLLIRGFLSGDKKLKRIMFIIIGAFLILGFKPYILFALLPAILFYYLFLVLPKLKVIGSLIILILLATITFLLFPTKREASLQLMSRKQYDFINISKGGLHVTTDSCFYFFKPEQYSNLLITTDSVQVIKTLEAEILEHGSISAPIPITLEKGSQKWPIFFMRNQSGGYIKTTLINNSFKQLMYNSPEALSNSLLRPYPNDPGGWLKYPAMLEVWLIFGFLIYAIIKRRKVSQNELSIILSISIFIIVLSLIIGWVTPVLGAIVRYRIPTYIGIVVIGLTLILPPKRYRINTND